MDKWMETAAKAALEAATATEKCTRQSALIADKSAKFLLNPRPESLYTAGTATKSTENHEGTNFGFLKLLTAKGVLQKAPFPLFFQVFFNRKLKAFLRTAFYPITLN